MIQYFAKIGIYSKKYSAEDINEILGISYDKCWVKGMARSPRSDVIRFERHAWFITAETSCEYTLDRQIENLYERIQPAIDKLHKIKDECEIVINCTIEGDENPILNFPNIIVNMINTIQASLDIDLLIV